MGIERPEGNAEVRTTMVKTKDVEKKFTTIFTDPEAAVMRLLPPVSVTAEPERE